jgi:flagellar assembly protein FliH
MILRDAIFSAERRHLGAQPAMSGAALTPGEPPAPPVLLGSAVREAAASYEVRAEAAPQARAAEAPLSSDRVASWLVTQDGATRTALAALLSDELKALRDAARTEGYERGHGEAMTEARDKVHGALEALAGLNAAAETAFESELAQLNAACADVIAEAFFKLAGTQLATREAIVGCVAEVLKRVREERELRIHVNPADLAVLRTAEAGIAASLPGRQFVLIADGRVETGGCIVESALGSLDGRLELQLAELCATLRAAKDPESAA